MGTVWKICQQDKNSECTGYSCQSPWSAPQQLSSQVLKQLISGPKSSPAPSPRQPFRQSSHAFSQPHFLPPSPLVRGKGRGPSSPTLWTIFLISSHLKLNQ